MTVLEAVLDVSADIDSLVGCWFWAGPFYHGQIAAEVAVGYYLLRFSDTNALPGVHEVVNISKIADQKWSIFATEDEMLAAIERKREKHAAG